MSKKTIGCLPGYLAVSEVDMSNGVVVPGYEDGVLFGKVLSFGDEGIDGLCLNGKTVALFRSSCVRMKLEDATYFVAPMSAAMAVLG